MSLHPGLCPLLPRLSQQHDGAILPPAGKDQACEEHEHQPRTCRFEGGLARLKKQDNRHGDAGMGMQEDPDGGEPKLCSMSHWHAGKPPATAPCHP